MAFHIGIILINHLYIFYFSQKFFNFFFIFTDDFNNCFFAPEFQGGYAFLQNTNDNIIYSHINITADSIPIWGLCYKRTGNNVILMISSEETSCFRCFNLKLVAKNILLVKTLDSDYISKCYTNEASVECPDDSHGDDKNFTEIILYSKLHFCCKKTIKKII